MDIFAGNHGAQIMHQLLILSFSPYPDLSYANSSFHRAAKAVLSLATGTFSSSSRIPLERSMNCGKLNHSSMSWL